MNSLNYKFHSWHFRWLLAIFLCISFISHDSLDPNEWNLISESQIENWFGTIGALISGFFFNQFGWLSYWFPLVLFIFERKVRFYISFFCFLYVPLGISVLLGAILSTFSVDEIIIQKYTGSLAVASSRLSQILVLKIMIIVVNSFTLILILSKYEVEGNFSFFYQKFISSFKFLKKIIFPKTKKIIDKYKFLNILSLMFPFQKKTYISHSGSSDDSNPLIKEIPKDRDFTSSQDVDSDNPIEDFFNTIRPN